MVTLKSSWNNSDPDFLSKNHISSKSTRGALCSSISDLFYHLLQVYEQAIQKFSSQINVRSRTVQEPSRTRDAVNISSPN